MGYGLIIRCSPEKEAGSGLAGEEGLPDVDDSPELDNSPQKAKISFSAIKPAG
jgi:hypothetical protein